MRDNLKIIDETNSSVLFDDFTLSDLFKEIVTNTRLNRVLIKLNLKKLTESILNTMDLQIFMSLVQGFMNTLVKNDLLLLKLAGVVTKMTSQRLKFLLESGLNTLSLLLKRYIMDQARRLINEIVNIDGIKKKKQSNA